MRPRRVLVIEDSPTQAERLRRFLAEEGIEVVHVDSAEKALDYLHKAVPDLILLDFHLPGMNGDVFCREIRMNVNTRAIPVLVLTAHGDDAAQLRSLDSGADDYLPKTADRDVLRLRVHALLRKTPPTGLIVDVEKRFSRARVLAIDDSPTYLYILSTELRAEHYLVETAETPEKGLSLLETTPFDCVLVDYEMPGMNGAEVCRRIRAMRGESEQELVLIMLSSHEDKTRLAQGFDAGADDYIAKSADISITKARLRALLRRKFLVEENRHILGELREKELVALRAQAAKEAAEIRAAMSEELARTNSELEIANGKLDKANQELEQFAAAAAHDLLEPLRHVSIYSQLIQRDFAGALGAPFDQYVASCVEGTARMNDLLRDLLIYARATREAIDIRKPTDLSTALETALGNLQTLIAETNANIIAEALPTLRVEEVRIQQLFQNLIANAMRHRRDSVVPEIHISARRDGSEWLFAVDDNGPGIGYNYLETIFEPFKRLQRNTTSGSGLGLSICKIIVERHGGRIWVESVLGVGSSFFFTLPAA